MWQRKSHVGGDTERCHSSPGQGCWRELGTHGTTPVGAWDSAPVSCPPHPQTVCQTLPFPGNTQTSVKFTGNKHIPSVNILRYCGNNKKTHTTCQTL